MMQRNFSRSAYGGAGRLSKRARSKRGGGWRKSYRPEISCDNARAYVAAVDELVAEAIGLHYAHLYGLSPKLLQFLFHKLPVAVPKASHPHLLGPRMHGTCSALCGQPANVSKKNKIDLSRLHATVVYSLSRSK